VRCERSGWGAALNDGIRQSRGAYILPLASGNGLHPHYLERAVQALQRAPDLAAVCCFAGKVLKQQSTDQLIGYTIPYDLHPLLVTLERYAEGSCSLFRRTVFDNVHYDEDLIAYADWELWWQLVEASFQVEVMPALLSYQRLPSDHPDWADIRRHVYVINQLADRHGSYLQHLSDGIFRFCAAETIGFRTYIDELQYDRDRLWAEIERLKQLFEERDHNWQVYTQELTDQRQQLLAEIQRLQQALDGRERG
jgi:GT2 family glycosyltransferase